MYIILMTINYFHKTCDFDTDSGLMRRYISIDPVLVVKLDFHRDDNVRNL